MEAIWVALGGNAAFLLVVAFLGRKLLSQWMEKDLEAFKHRLASAASKELEVLKGQLQVAANEHSILLSRLQEKRAQVIGELYSRIAHGVRELESYVRPLQLIGEEGRGEKAAKARTALVEAQEFYDKQQIWLTTDCATKVQELLELLRGTFNRYDMARQAAERHAEAQRGERETDEWIRAWETVTGLVATTRRSLEGDMRKLLEPIRPITAG